MYSIQSEARRRRYCPVAFVLPLLATSLPLTLGAQSTYGISDPAYTLINTRTMQNQGQFFVYQDMDSGFNHGFPSGLFGSSQVAMTKLTRSEEHTSELQS